MKPAFFLLFALIISTGIIAQPSTEVYLFDFTLESDSLIFTNPLNVSDNEGYDNQPSFSDDGNFLLFASTRQGQTDILQYEIKTGEKKWLTSTPGGEYSPKYYKNHSSVTAVRLDEDGFQRLYLYKYEEDENKVLIMDTVVGYYDMYNDQVLSFVLGEPQTLQLTDLNSDSTTIIDENPGRSIHHIPNSDYFSYIAVSDSRATVIQLNPSNKQKTSLAPMLENSLDMAWLSDDTMISGRDSELYLYPLNDTQSWKITADLSEFELENITRIAVHSASGKIALVVDGK